MTQSAVFSETQSIERRRDFISGTRVDLAIDIEATLGVVQAILYMRKHNIDMTVALRVVLRSDERRDRSEQESTQVHTG